MYDLTVDEAHTFFVGDGQWLVHNSCDGTIIVPADKNAPPRSGTLEWENIRGRKAKWTFNQLSSLLSTITFKTGTRTLYNLENQTRMDSIPPKPFQLEVYFDVEKNMVIIRGDENGLQHFATSCAGIAIDLVGHHTHWDESTLTKINIAELRVEKV